MRSLIPIRLVAVLLLASACRSSPAVAPASTSTGAATPSARRAILLSIDGAGADELWRLHREHAFGPDGFERFFAEGEVAERMIPTEPTLTAPNHASLVTGHPPATTGIVSNTFHAPGDSLRLTTDGFAAPIAAETLWQAARRQGRRAGVVAWPNVEREPGVPGAPDWALLWSGQAYPAHFTAALARGGVVSPGEPDTDALDAEGVGTVDRVVEQMRRFARYFIDAILVGAESEGWDLIVGYVPVIDEMMHSMLLVDPRQARWSVERERAFAAARLRVWRAVDGEVARLLAHVDLRATSVFLVSDHGLRPLRAVFYPNVLLQREGLLHRDADRRVDTATSRAVVVTSAAVGHLYLNLAGREPDGIVAPGDAPALLGRIHGLLATASVDGEQPLRAVLTRAEAARLGMDHANGGDLVLIAAPGWALAGGEPPPESARGNGLARSDDGGQHGYLESEEPAMDAIFLALGPGIAHRTLPPLRNLEVAPRVARAIGIEPPHATAP